MRLGIVIDGFHFGRNGRRCFQYSARLSDTLLVVVVVGFCHSPQSKSRDGAATSAYFKGLVNPEQLLSSTPVGYGQV